MIEPIIQLKKRRLGLKVMLIERGDIYLNTKIHDPSQNNPHRNPNKVVTC